LWCDLNPDNFALSLLITILKEMKNFSFLVLFSVLLLTACDKDDKDPALPGAVKDIKPKP
jgi:hypothetical protein